MIHRTRATHFPPSRCYSFDRETYDRAARNRQAIGLGLGLSIGQNPQPAPGPGVTNFATLFTSVIESVQSDIAITSSGGLITQAGTYYSAAGAARPSVGSGSGGKPSIDIGTSQSMASSTAGYPGVHTIWAVLAIVGAGGGGSTPIFAQGSPFGVFQYSGSTNIGLYHGGVVGPLTPGTTAYKRLIANVTLDAASYLKFGSVQVTGDPGTTVTTSRAMGGGSNISVLAMVAMSGAASTHTAELAAADTAANTYYAAALTT